MHAESPEEVAKRFQREAQLGASLNHPNVVSIFDIETDRENVLIVMEYVPGGTLKDALARGPLPRDAAFKVLRGIAAALDYAHEHHVIHRDVKPANVLLDDDGRAKLADLGIATAAEVTSITSTGAVLGTASYMPPERLDGQPGGKEADIYGLATVAYETLTGRKARQGRSAVEIAAMVMSEPPPDLRVHVPDAPEEAARVLERGMARDPAARPGSAGELVRELCQAFEDVEEPVEPTAPTAAAPADTQGVRDDHTPAASPAPTYKRQRAGSTRSQSRSGSSDRRWILPVAGLVVALLAVSLVLALSGGDDSGSGGGGSEQSSESESGSGSGDVGGESQSGGGGSAPETNESGTAPEAGGGTGGTGAPPTGGSGGADSPPAQAVSDFYTRAANDDFEGAWELAGPGVRRQLGGFQTFRNTLDTLESIEFPTLEVESQTGSTATVRLKSVARHTNRTDNCSGTARTASSGGTWKVERLNVDCTPG
jgi:serine/threonine protein kinase